MESTELNKMLRGELYNPEELCSLRLRAQHLVKSYNESSPAEVLNRKRILVSLSEGGIKESATVVPPFYCDYGFNLNIGENCFINYNCVLLDCNQISLGNNVLLGPSVQIYTAEHPTDPQTRLSGLEFAKPVSIGENVWIGGGAIVLGGVCIGSNTTIGAGSVVTKNIPSNAVAVGNPCAVVKTL